MCECELCKNLCMDTSNSEIGLECQSPCKGAYVRKKRHMFVRVWVGVCVHVCEWVYVSGCVCVLCVCVCAHVCVFNLDQIKAALNSLSVAQDPENA